MVTLESYPNKILTGTTKSKWNSIHHPIIFEFQRSDYFIVSVIEGSAGRLIVNTSLSTNIGVNPRETVYIRSGNYDGVFSVESNSGYSFTVLGPYTGDGIGGFVNSDVQFRNWFLQMAIYTIDTATNTYVYRSTRRYYPDQRGVIPADVSGVLRTVARLSNTFDYSEINSPEELMSGAFNIQYREVYNGSNNQYVEFALGTKHYFTNSAKQLLDWKGANMATFVPCPDLTTARFLGPNCKYTYWPNFPFSMSFIYSELIQGYTVSREMDLFDASGNILVHYSDNITSTLAYVQRINHLMIDEIHDITTYAGTPVAKIEVWLQYSTDAIQAPYFEASYAPADYAVISQEIPSEPQTPTNPQA